MPTPWYHDIAEWRSRLDGVTETTNGIRGLCPAHADSTPSLDVDERDGKVVWKCRAGCDQKAVTDALGGERGPSIVLLAKHRVAPRPTKRKAPPPDAKADPLGWYASYIGVDRTFLDELPLTATVDGWVSHDFPTGVAKQRQAGTSERRWSPQDAHNPAVWPLDDAMPKDVLLTEGETDAIALRAGGYPMAYSAGSASGVPSVADFRAMARRGVQTVYVAYDADDAGQKGAAKAMENAVAAGLHAARIVPPDYDSLAGTGKDWREWRIAGGDALPESNYGEVVKPIARIVAETPATVPWAAFPVAYFGGVSVLAGPPKGGKSTLVGHIARCAETGEKFLGEFDVKRGTPLLLMTEEHGVPVVTKTRAFGLSAMEVVQRADAVRAGWGLGDALSAAARWLGEQDRPSIVVIDTLAVWASIENENDAGEATAAIETIRHALADRGATVILVHHTRKGGGIAGEATRGSGAIAASCDVQAELTYYDAADATDSRRWLTVRGRVMETTRILLAYDTATHTYSVADTSDEDNAELLSWIEGVPRPSEDADGVTSATLETTWGITDGRKRIAKLVRMKLLRRSDDMVKAGRGLEYRYWRSDVAFVSDRRTDGLPVDRVETIGVESEAGGTPLEGVPTHEATDGPMHEPLGGPSVHRSSSEPTIKGQKPEKEA